MTENASYIPFIKWGQYKSVDEKSPDILQIKVVETTTFDTEYGTNVRVQLREGGSLKDAVLPLKSYASANASLLNLWEKHVKTGTIKPGIELRLKTWLGTTRTTNWPIRRFAVEV